METSLLKEIKNFRVSSVLNRDVKQFGKKFLFDNNNDTCWNSDQGSQQWITLLFEELISLEKFKLCLQFQGGFCGKLCCIQIEDSSEKCHTLDFYPDDVNKLQTFTFEPETKILTNNFKILFKSSTDFFGRIIVYKLELLNV